MFTEARKLLMMIDDVSPRGHFFEPYAACVGFISLNSDRHLKKKLAPSGDRLLTKQQRLALIEMATAESGCSRVQSTTTSPCKICVRNGRHCISSTSR
jgi:hypothetical protein